MTATPPHRDSPPSALSKTSTRSRRLSDTLRSSLHKSTKFIFVLSPVLSRLLSKTLDFFSMDSLFFSADDDDFFDRDRTLGPHRPAFEFDNYDEQIYFVPYSWWSDARDSLSGDSSKVEGVLYAAESSLGIGGFDSKPEIFLNMRRQNVFEKNSDAKQGHYALIPEWMFLRAFKWYSESKDHGAFLAAEDNMPDLFPLRIRLSVSSESNSLVVKISQKDNEAAAFRRACNIFSMESGLLSIWDFSGQTTQFFTGDSIRLSDDLDQLDKEILLELQVYGSLHFMKTREGKGNEITVEDSLIGSSLEFGSLRMNGSTSLVNSYHKVKKGSSLGGNYKQVCTLGLKGLYNLGNTCFMNSAIQCLVHTPKLVDYFLGDYRRDINTENPLGMHGGLALAFGDLLRKLWAPGTAPIAPRAFKSKLAAVGPQFSGYNQHDSQEFLAFLLDGLHEDLNRVKRKPYVEVKDAEGRPDKEVADEYWKNHLARNDSFIVNVCQGQYRSTLVCPVCKKLSITFDPFMYLSLPLPSTTMRSMTLTVMSSDGTSLPSPVTVTVPKYGRCKDLVQALSTASSLRDDETLLVAEVYNNAILHFLDKPSDSIELIRDDDQLVAYRLPKDCETSPLFVFMHEMVERHIIRGTLCSKFGIPLVTRLTDLSRGSEIKKQFQQLVRPFLNPAEDSFDDDDSQNCGNEDVEMVDVIRTRLSDGDANSDSGLGYYSNLGPDFQFYLMEDRGLLTKGPQIDMNEPVSIPESTGIINVLVSWPDKMMKIYDTSLLSYLPQICKPGLLTKQAHEPVSLYKCLEAFLREEPLGPEDMWYCPNCKKHRQASKKLDLWRLPEILIIHLKRFSYSRFFKNKLETFVDFPIDDFNLSTYTVNKDSHVSHRYMVYAISNHYGGMGGGHYTAFVQYGHDRWFEFDDSHVSSVGEDQIKTSAAYVLFYRRMTDS